MTPSYEVLSRVVVRAPLLPAAEFTASGDDLSDRCADPSFRFALAVASPDLVSALDRPGGPTPTARAAAQRYLIRAATRPTPFGGFAAIGLAPWSDQTDLTITGDRRPTRTRPDLRWLTDLTRRLAGDPELRPRLRVYANSCALLHEGRYYLADPGTGGTRSGPDVSVRATTVVQRALDLAREPVRWDDLARRLGSHFASAPAGRVDSLLETLAEQQFLLPELLPPLIGDPLSVVRSRLREASPSAAGPEGGGADGAGVDWAGRLGEVAAACRAVDDSPPGEAAGQLARLRAVLPAVHAEGTPDVQVDSALPLAGGVNRRLAHDAVAAAELLLCLHPDPSADPLAGYRAAFHRRYGDRRVPVLELLDPRFGLGSPASHTAHPTGHPAGHRQARDGLLLDLAATAIRDATAEVELTDDLLERLTVRPPQPERWPDSLELSLFVAAADREALDRGDYQLAVGPNLGAQQAGRGLGRFADLLGPEALELLAEAAGSEPADARGEHISLITGKGVGLGVGAELVYRPLRSRSANVAVRPLVGGYELPIGVAPSVPSERVLRVDELSVTLIGGRFRLVWDRGDRPVRLSTGHMLNPAAAPPLGRALLDLSDDGTLWLPSFDWGPATGLPFLPRVRRGRVVLSPARWRLSPAPGTPYGAEDLDRWRKEWQVPRVVSLASGDHRLWLDLDEETHRQQVLDALGRTRSALTLQEAFPGPEQAWLPGPAGRHVVEIVVPMRRRRLASTSGVALPQDGPAATTWARTERHRPPGSDWLYVTLDGPLRTENSLLTGSLGELLRDLSGRGLADGWFFVRYADPDRQLRIRLHGAPAGLVGQVLPELTGWAAAAIAGGLRTRLTLETYERELERYGGPETTGICERIACADSVAVCALLPHLADDPDLAVASFADLLLSLAGQDDDRRREWARRLSHDAAAGGPEFRERKGRLRKLIGTGAGLDPAVADAFAKRRSAVAALIGHRCDEFGDLADSIVHLHANRLGLDRAAEDRTRGLLDRTLRSLAAFP